MEVRIKEDKEAFRVLLCGETRPSVRHCYGQIVKELPTHELKTSAWLSTRQSLYKTFRHRAGSAHETAGRRSQGAVTFVAALSRSSNIDLEEVR